jgi:hypothetical protein
MEMSACFICLDEARGINALTTHLICHHGWTSLPGNPHARISFYHWAFLSLSKCFTLLKSSQTKEDYLAEVSFPFLTILSFLQTTLAMNLVLKRVSSTSIERESMLESQTNGSVIKRLVHSSVFRAHFTNLASSYTTS